MSLLLPLRSPAAGCLIFLASAVAGHAGAEPLDVLWFGNSFSQQGDVPGTFARIAEADGHEAPRVVADLEGGTGLRRHRERVAAAPRSNVDSPELAGGETYGFVVLQSHSTESTHLRNPGFVRDAVSLHREVAGHASGRGAGVRAVLYQTWARGGSHGFYRGNPPAFAGPAAMQGEINASFEEARRAIDEAAGPGAARVAPVGSAFEAGGFDAGLYDTDHHHASVRGRLLASLLLYRTVYEEGVSDIAFADVSGFVGVDEAEWKELAVLADSVAIPDPEAGTR